MKKVGTTAAGTVIVEMTTAQFEALSQLHSAAASDTMSSAEKVAYVRERLAKLSPKKKDGVVRSILAMFQFTGGIAESEAEAIIADLQHENFLAIDDHGRVTYKNG